MKKEKVALKEKEVKLVQRVTVDPLDLLVHQAMLS